MTRAALAASLVLALMTLGGCGKKRIPECDAVLATMEKLAMCPKLADDQRKPILDNLQTLRDSVRKAQSVDDPPADLVSSMRDACRTQDTSLQQMYADCLE